MPRAKTVRAVIDDLFATAGGLQLSRNIRANVIAPPPAGPTVDALPVDSKRPYILSVDDETDVTDIIAFNLRKQGYEVQTAADGRTALDLIARRRPDLLLLDLMLPDIDGFAVCEILRRRTDTVTLPIVILSAWSEPDSRHLGLELGAIDFLNKPFSPRDLVKRVDGLLGARRASASSTFRA